MPIRTLATFAAVVAMAASCLIAADPAPAIENQKPQIENETHWSLQPLKKPLIPSVAPSLRRFVANPIDAFILSQLEKSNLSPSPEADRPTLIRRLSYDLIGLPPTPAEIDAFVNDKSPDACEKLVDRLLASPRYGERWARHWLDVVRYTESQGFEYDKLRENAWHYRDYVIRAFNDDKPYNRFMSEQIAGDVLPDASADTVIATSLLVCGPWDEAGNGQANATQRLITREEEMEDLLSVVGQSFLGLTLNCARCHTHKFDPIPHTDYYRIKSIFDGVKHGERSIESPQQIKQREANSAALKIELTGHENSLRKIETDARARAIAALGTAERPAAGPVPFARWTFDADAKDSVGALHGELHNGARIERGRLIVDGKGAFFRSAPIARDIREKTIEAWVALPTLNQGGGGVITLESANGTEFDSIVYAERQPKKWMAGSSGFVRTKDLSAAEETSAPGALIHMAIVYRADNSIKVYRNGKLYADTYTPRATLQPYKSGDGHILMGMRHTGGGNPFLNGEIEQASLYDRALSEEEVAASFASAGFYITEAQMLARLTKEQSAERDNLIKLIKSTRDRLSTVVAPGVSYAGTRIQPAPTARLNRGDVRKPAEIVSPGALSCIAEPAADFALSPDASEGERRLKFAHWLADPRNPLPPRVIANRIWHYHFGQGIVATPNDLGVAGAKPTHPELLDYLAGYLIENNWSLKKLHKLIVTSATYRQSSSIENRKLQIANPREADPMKIDAGATLLWRFPPRRLEAEAIRDATLAVAGQLNLTMYGPSFKPFVFEPFPANVYRPVDKVGPEFNRRTIYRMNVNSGKDPMLDSFDCPDPSVKTPRRGMTTTPLQALAMMNNSFIQRMSGHFADRVLKESNNDTSAAIALAYRHALGRPATPGEIARATALAREHGLKHVCWAILNSSEFLYVN